MATIVNPGDGFQARGNGDTPRLFTPSISAITLLSFTRASRVCIAKRFIVLEIKSAERENQKEEGEK